MDVRRNAVDDANATNKVLPVQYGAHVHARTEIVDVITSSITERESSKRSNNTMSENKTNPELTVPVTDFLLIYDTFIHKVTKRKVNFKFTNDNSSVKYHLLIPWRPSCKA